MCPGNALCTCPELCHLRFLWLTKIGLRIVHGLMAGLTAFHNKQSATLDMDTGLDTDCAEEMAEVLYRKCRH